MKKRTRKHLVVNPFVSEAQRRACYAQDDPDWDCHEWEQATPEGKKLPAKVARAKKGLKANRHRSPLREREREGVANLSSAQVDLAASRAVEPTEAQKEAGNYRAELDASMHRKGHVVIQGLDVTIENPRGTRQLGHSVTLKHHYGYVKGTLGADGDHVDVFIGPNPESTKVFIVDQLRRDGKTFDEHKCLIGFDSLAQARQGYASSYPPGWKVGRITRLSMDAFKAWLRDGDKSKPLLGVTQNADTTSSAFSQRTALLDDRVSFPLLAEDPRTLSWEERRNLSQGKVLNASSSGRILEVPDVRQRDHYSCGAACAMSVGRWFGVGPKTLDQWKHALGTDVQESTLPSAIVGYLRSLGLEVIPRDGMTVDGLAALTQQGKPIICPVQDYGPRVPRGARFAYGHYLVVIGVVGEPGDRYVVCQDPSADNVVAGGDSAQLSRTGSIQKPGRILIDEVTWDSVWHDRDAQGTKYVRYGIAVGPGAAQNWQPLPSGRLVKD